MDYMSGIPCSLNVSGSFKRTNTAQYSLFVGEIFYRPSGFEVKASTLNAKNSHLYEAGILLGQQQK